MLADLWDRDRIVQKADGGRRSESIREIPAGPENAVNSVGLTEDPLRENHR